MRKYYDLEANLASTDTEAPYYDNLSHSPKYRDESDDESSPTSKVHGAPPIDAMGTLPK